MFSNNNWESLNFGVTEMFSNNNDLSVGNGHAIFVDVKYGDSSVHAHNVATLKYTCLSRPPCNTYVHMNKQSKIGSLYQ